MSVRTQVVLGVGSLVGLLVVAGVAAVVLLVGVHRDQRQLDARDMPYAGYVSGAALAAKGSANDERGFLLSGGQAAYREEAERRISEAEAAFGRAAGAAATGAQRAAVVTAHVQFDRWVAAVRDEFTAYASGRQSTIAAAVGPNRALRKRYEAALTRAQTMAARAIRSQSASVDSASSRSVEIVLGLLIVALVVGVVVAVWLVRVVLAPVHHLIALLGDYETIQWRRD